MALLASTPPDLKFRTCDKGDGTFIKFYELTGLYSSTSNLYGWGNPLTDTDPIMPITSTTWATVTIQKYGSEDEYTIDVWGSLPSDNPNYFLKIYGTSFGFAAGEKIESGVYLITYKVGHAGLDDELIVDAYESKYVCIMPKLRCCIKAVRQEMNIPGSNPCNCKDEKITALATADQILKGICENAECDEPEKANTMISYLIKYCSCNCKTC